MLEAPGTVTSLAREPLPPHGSLRTHVEQYREVQNSSTGITTTCGMSSRVRTNFLCEPM